MRIRTVRRFSQLVFILLFILLLILTADPLRSFVPVDLFMRSSALSALTAMLASREIITGFTLAGVMIVVALVLGRVFCGWVCPFGTTLDLTDRLFRKVRARRDGNRVAARSTPVHSAKYVALITALAAALFGVQIAGWVDPLSIVTRTYGMVIYPYVHFWANSVLDPMLDVPGLRNIALGIDGIVRPGLLMLEQPLFAYHWLMALIFVGIASFGMVERRYWCRHLCPLGAIYDLLGRKAVLRRYVKDGCIHCNACVRECKMNAIEEGGEVTRRGECIECFACNAVCPVDVSTFRFGVGSSPQLSNEVDLTRRGLIASAFAGLIAVPMSRMNFRGKRGQLYLIRPPGADDEETFLAKCVRCGECMKVCLTNGLHPTVWEAGLEGMFTPRLVPRMGYCEYNCTLCGHVCPSGAIPLLTEDEKHDRPLGTAFFDRTRCIPWAQNRTCAVCEENCPVPDKAIILRPEKVVEPMAGETVTVRRPYVVIDRCVGCGLCESKCPLPGESAVRVGPRLTETDLDVAAVANANDLPGIPAAE